MCNHHPTLYTARPPAIALAIYQGTAPGPWTSPSLPSLLTPSASFLTLPSAFPATFSAILIFRNPHLPSIQIRPRPRLDAIVGGARTNAAPLTMPPNAEAPTAATMEPTNAYFA